MNWLQSIWDYKQYKRALDSSRIAKIKNHGEIAKEASSWTAIIQDLKGKSVKRDTEEINGPTFGVSHSHPISPSTQHIEPFKGGIFSAP